MNNVLSREFIVAFAMIVVAAALSIMGAVILALPLGLAGGYLLIQEMIKQYFK
jgi:hypothetical protein